MKSYSEIIYLIPNPLKNAKFLSLFLRDVSVKNDKNILMESQRLVYREELIYTNDLEEIT